MIRNYVKIAVRNLRKNRMYSSINIAGLAIGVAACLLITLFVRDEQSYDRFLPDAEQIFQVNVDGNFGGTEFITSNTPPPAGKTMKSEFAEVETFTRTFQPYDAMIQRKQNGQALHYYTESNVLAVDSNFLDVFRFGLLAGNTSATSSK